jgi:DNA-directed RNA polymerase sigma subunit (sigma70/sigma32)
MNEYWEVVSHWTGKVIAQCGEESDAKMLCELSPKERNYRKARFIVDQVIDVTSTTDKQLPGQQGLPAAKIRLEDAQQQLELRGSDAEVFVP